MTTSTQSEAPRGFISTWILDFHNRTVLFRIGNWLFTTYAFLAGTAFAMGFAVSLWFDAMHGMNTVYIAKLYLFIAVPSVLVGLRAFSIMLEWRELFRRPLATLIKPGYMLHGGIAGGTLGLLAVSYMAGVPLLRILDAPAFAMPLGEAIARLGCFVYGCCWGRPTRGSLGSRFGVRYTSKDSKVLRAAPHLENVKIHPAQLYALVVYLGMFAVFYTILPYMPFDGALTGLYLIGHSIIRISLEYFRQDDRGRLWGKLTHTNLYSAVMILGGVAALTYGSLYSATSTPDLGVRLVHVFFDGNIFPWICLYGVVFGFAYGVHYKKVGSWISSPSSGMSANVNELSMGAASRMEAQARDDEKNEEEK
ncbi:MAG: prolipoprotein diacylglyceryl transferase family protein [Myxococcota bacterium]